MAGLPDQILELLETSPGLSDREITDALRGPDRPQQPVNQVARQLASAGKVTRRPRADGRIGNYLSGAVPTRQPADFKSAKNHDVPALSEDEIKSALDGWLSQEGWSTTVAWGRQQGIDIDAKRGLERWIIEVKGPGSRPQMRVNYFLSMLGETLQRMDDPDAKYSIALPDLPQYRGLWERLPSLARKRTGISMLLVSLDGHFEELA